MPVFEVGEYQRVLRVNVAILEELVPGPALFAHLSDPTADASYATAEQGH